MSRPGRFFAWDEFEHSDTAARLGLDNRVTIPEHREAIAYLCGAVLDPLRASLGRPVRITSGYRSQALNEALNGATNSQHMRGEAADIKVDGMDARELMQRIVALRLDFDQLVWYAPERGGHVHVSITRGKPRGQVLHAPAGGGYQ